MKKSAKVIKLHPVKKATKENRIKNIDGVKYFNNAQIKQLRRTVRDQADLDIQKGKVTGQREWMVIDVLTSTGIRVSEAANIRCGDIKAGYGQSELFVRDGKGSISRTIQIPDYLKKHLKQFLKWKREHSESTGNDDHLFVGQRGPWSRQAIHQVVKTYLKVLDLCDSGKSAHALRHSYAVQLYRQQRDLRTVQKQLGHVSIQSTQIYADVTKEDIQDQLWGFWN